jgi:N6-adenosine-specific RNA methylase IME4
MKLPAGPFKVLYADPPWYFKTYSSKGNTKSPEQHYDCMGLDEIKALPVDQIAARDAVLFIWVVQPMIPQALEVITAWGFTYKTVAFCWVKLSGDSRQPRLFIDPADVRKGLGYHTCSGMEQCFLATRGKGYERLDMSVSQVHFEAIREHSRKPDHFAAEIERLTGVETSKIELFCRTPRPGWAHFGNQVGKFDLEPAYV